MSPPPTPRGVKHVHDHQRHKSTLLSQTVDSQSVFFLYSHFKNSQITSLTTTDTTLPPRGNRVVPITNDRLVSKVFFPPQPFHVIGIQCGDPLICMVAVPLAGTRTRNWTSAGAKRAFSLNNPFNLSSIMWKWLRAVILLQFEGSGSKLTGMRTAGESLPCTELVMEARV